MPALGAAEQLVSGECDEIGPRFEAVEDWRFILDAVLIEVNQTPAA